MSADKFNLLFSFLLEKSDRKFAWGVNDCCLFAADWVNRLTGTDPMADIRGTYWTQEEAAAVIEKLGGLENSVAERLKVMGAIEVSHMFAQRGDIVTANLEAGMTVGICVGTTFVAAGPKGFGHASMASVNRAWRVN